MKNTSKTSQRAEPSPASVKVESKNGLSAGSSSGVAGDYVDFMAQYGVDVVWHKIVSQDLHTPDKVSVTVTHGTYDVSPKGNAITRDTLGEALDELYRQIKNREAGVPNPAQVVTDGSTVTASQPANPR